MTNQIKPRVEFTESKKAIYQTTDIQAAGALISAGHKLIEVVEQTSRHSGRSNSVFVFANDGIKESLTKYTNDELLVSAKTLYDNFRNLKNWVHNKGAE